MRSLDVVRGGVVRAGTVIRVRPVGRGACEVDTRRRPEGSARARNAKFQKRV